MYSLPYLEPICCSMSSSNCCFLICIQNSQEAGKVVWYSHLFQNFPRFIVIHTVKGFTVTEKEKKWNQGGVQVEGDRNERYGITSDRLCQHLLDHGKSKRVPEKHLFLLY